MVIVKFEDDFKIKVSKIKHAELRLRIKKQIARIVQDPEVGKPMGYGRKNTGEVYVRPFRLSYSYLKEENFIIFLDFYHKDEQ